ncbi:MAG: hypothetical protein ACXVFT_09340 [Solirubrobacteraceae bacterium]
MLRPSLILSLALLALVPPAASAASCTGNPSSVQRLGLTVGGQPTYGLYTLPASTPRGMVVFGHGYSYNVDAWRQHMIRAATKDGLVAVTMDYRGLKDLPKDQTGFERARGWPVKAGSEDLVAAGQYFDRLCGGFDRRFLLGVSMGGNSTGLTAALKAKTLDGRPLFDYWVGIEGVWNLTELANQARAAGPTNPFAQNAYDDIVGQTGGTPEQKPDAYAERTVVTRASDIAASGLRGIVLVHAIDDGQASYDQAQQMRNAMRAAGTPTDLYSVSRKADGDTPDSTLDGNQTMAGHAPEWSTHHISMDTGFDALSALAAETGPPPCNRDFSTDGQANPHTTPDPGTPAPGCPAKPTFSGRAARPSDSAKAPAGCSDALAPALSAKAITKTRHRLALRGTAKDRGCAGLSRVRIAVARRAGNDCRFVDRARTGHLTSARSCTRRRPFLRPRGAARYRLTLRGLRRGTYRVTTVATDRAGQHRTVTRTVHVR